MPTTSNGLGGTENEPHDLADLQTYLSQIIGVVCDPDLLRRAMTHRSYAYEHDEAPDNERLEFLGDAVLGVIVTDSLYRNNPESAEGQLAKLRAAVVNTRALADVARAAGLGAYIFLGRGEEATGGREKASILADTTEAVIGCAYLCHGMPAASALVHHLLDPLMAESAHWGAALDWKTSLQELASTAGLGGPEYQVGSEGPDHDKIFTARAFVGDEVMGQGEGTSKKAAEQAAAQQAWEELSSRAAVVEVPSPVASEAAASAKPDETVST